MKSKEKSIIYEKLIILELRELGGVGEVRVQNTEFRIQESEEYAEYGMRSKIQESGVRIQATGIMR